MALARSPPSLPADSSHFVAQDGGSFTTRCKRVEQSWRGRSRKASGCTRSFAKIDATDFRVVGGGTCSSRKGRTRPFLPDKELTPTQLGVATTNVENAPSVPTDIACGACQEELQRQATANHGRAECRFKADQSHSHPAARTAASTMTCQSTGSGPYGSSTLNPATQQAVPTIQS